MTFDFDSNEHKAFEKTPAAKAINTPAGIWVANDNKELAGWTDNKEGKSFGVGTRKYNQDGEEIKIPGTIFTKPRLLVIQRSLMLRMDSTGRVDAIWQKGDKDKGFKAIRRYMVIFLNSENKPLHIAPLQLTAKGSFQVNFDQQLIKFRKEAEETYALASNKSREPKNALWHSMWVFCPELKTELRENSGQSSPACITKGYEVPEIKNWTKHCIGKDEYAQDVATLHQSTVDWWTKGLLLNNQSQNIEQQIEEDEDDGYSPRGATKSDYEDINGYASIDEEEAPF